jgi:hypothetical protein
VFVRVLETADERWLRNADIRRPARFLSALVSESQSSQRSIFEAHISGYAAAVENF